MKLRDITDAIGSDDRPALWRAFCALVEHPEGEVVEASSGGLLIVALNRLCVTLKDDAATMPPRTCAALQLPPGATYADGAAQAKRDSARLARQLMAAGERLQRNA
ncbi:hypothetical protein B6S44_25005 [Bosea sp. Tri-44]|uniref:hypothetical protein n=1 Tax=Bosea sp. Tri-44 TaxID=1972137 RepID=UPI00100EA40E|nr:hypothetical protein [Bosea sp. Tri-44]RXT46104.1 hypothetical protein B6S44_25005 [Bosea sp. Tri-44]